MNKIEKRFCGFVCSAGLFITFVMGSISASALENGIYLADATPYYAHPYTGVIEDSGGESSSVLGQSMTESALCPQALIEVDSSGNMYATIRLSLMDNIENPQFMVQEDGYSSFYDVSADCMQENLDNNTSDFRISIPNENSIVRSTFYVVPMGRDVIFYIGFSNLTEGSGDFVASVEVAAPTEEQPQIPAETEAPVQTAATEITTIAATTVTTANTTKTTTIAVTTVVSDSTSTVTLPVQAFGNHAKGIAMFDENGIEIKEMSNQDVSENAEKDNRNVGIAVGVTTCAIVIIGGVSVVLYKRKRGGK